MHEILGIWEKACSLPYVSFILKLYLVVILQIPSVHIVQYTAQVLGVILALLDDTDESVQLTAVSCLLTVGCTLSLSLMHSDNDIVQWNISFLIFLFHPQILDSARNEAVEPILLNLSMRLRNLQVLLFLPTKDLLIVSSCLESLLYLFIWVLIHIILSYITWEKRKNSKVKYFLRHSTEKKNYVLGHFVESRFWLTQVENVSSVHFFFKSIVWTSLCSLFVLILCVLSYYVLSSYILLL